MKRKEAWKVEQRANELGKMIIRDSNGSQASHSWISPEIKLVCVGIWFGGMDG